MDAGANERIGLAGRWWREEWDSALEQWTHGTNSFDSDYYEKRYIEDLSSPTSYHYKFTGYLVFDYFITDQDGNATLSFEANSSYHVLWATNDSDIYDPPGDDGPDYTGHRDRSSNDGPLKQTTFDADESGDAYDDTGEDFPPRTVAIFGEWERLPVGGIFLQPGDYSAEIVLTEESFHGSGGDYAGNWAAAMGADI